MSDLNTPQAEAPELNDSGPPVWDQVPVVVGFAIFTLELRAACCRVLTGLAVSLVLSTLPIPTIVFVMPLTAPVNVAPESEALPAKALAVAVLTGLLASLVLSTLSRPTSALLPDVATAANCGLPVMLPQVGTYEPGRASVMP
ncbi:hypothetical protein D3C87_942120 [compost metagenome]